MSEATRSPPALPSQSSRILVLAVAGAFLALLFGLTFLQARSPAFPILLAATALLILLTGALAAWVFASRISFEIASRVKPVHWVQLCVQFSIIAALGVYSDDARAYIPLVFYQLFFASLLQIFLAAFFEKKFEFSFAVFPIVFSINLFLRFQPEYFYCQLLMVAFAITAKFFIVRPGGRHIFNPSGFALAAAVYGLLAFKPSNFHDVLSFGMIAAYGTAPNILLCWIFLVSAISLYLADRYLVTIGGVLVLAAAFFGGKLLFGHPFLPQVVHPNVFVGLTLLITDPMTSPKNKAGQLLFGMAYGLSIIAGFALLDFFQYTAVFDKILFVPLLNAAVPLFEKARDPAFLSPLFRNLRLQIALHAVLFLMTVVPYRNQPGCLACFTKTDIFEKKLYMQPR